MYKKLFFLRIYLGEKYYNNILNLSLAYWISKNKRVEHYATCTDPFCFYMKVHAFKTMLISFFKKWNQNTVLWFTIYLCKQKTVFWIIRSRKSGEYSSYNFLVRSLRHFYEWLCSLYEHKIEADLYISIIFDQIHLHHSLLSIAY